MTRGLAHNFVHKICAQARPEDKAAAAASWSAKAQAERPGRRSWTKHCRAHQFPRLHVTVAGMLWSFEIKDLG